MSLLSFEISNVSVQIDLVFLCYSFVYFLDNNGTGQTEVGSRTSGKPPQKPFPYQATFFIGLLYPNKKHQIWLKQQIIVNSKNIPEDLVKTIHNMYICYRFTIPLCIYV